MKLRQSAKFMASITRLKLDIRPNSGDALLIALTVCQSLQSLVIKFSVCMVVCHRLSFILLTLLASIVQLMFLIRELSVICCGQILVLMRDGSILREESVIRLERM